MKSKYIINNKVTTELQQEIKDFDKRPHRRTKIMCLSQDANLGDTG